MSDLEQLMMIRGAVAMMGPDEAAKVETALADLREVLAKHGESGMLALAIAGAELAAKGA
ncbi:hypothetical protein WS87_08520 [Burkholderia sp. MSMB0856]|uniref:hypothetical protein n=1 Tax=Burkholderia sp. MSMB0856 TaxID=1637869 RepID=UPI0007531AC2|nr:hypothetical protein [Burkholderia sp. MSMB0856]AOJ86711.1 hypothetical protein WS87_08520 [Burkholderia sp. MSMB0856]KVH38052.1 hypothetical protein WS87_00130 [Burkholderia sp. MSMB0856]